MTEAERKRDAALDAVGPFVTNDPPDVRWLLCGRGRPVSAGSSPYTVAVDDASARVYYQNIERSRVEAEERWDELGYEPVPYPWFEAAPESPTHPDLAALRRSLGPDELERYRAAGADVAAAFVETLAALSPGTREVEATAELAWRLSARGFTTPVLLAGGEGRAPLHRHPLPTVAPLARFALLAATAERKGLHVSMTRIVSFGSPPDALERVVRAAAEVDAAVLAASRPGRALGELFAVLSRAYEEHGYPDEWRKHHQGGLTGYRGREVFATPANRTALPEACALAWNPSVTGGGKSEDTALATQDGLEIVTRTRDLPEVETAAGIARAGVVEL